MTNILLYKKKSKTSGTKITIQAKTRVFPRKDSCFTLILIDKYNANTLCLENAHTYFYDE